jgi:hypothetical protein
MPLAVTSLIIHLLRLIIHSLQCLQEDSNILNIPSINNRIILQHPAMYLHIKLLIIIHQIRTNNQLLLSQRSVHLPIQHHHMIQTCNPTSIINQYLLTSTSPLLITHLTPTIHPTITSKRPITLSMCSRSSSRRPIDNPCTWTNKFNMLGIS